MVATDFNINLLSDLADTKNYLPLHLDVTSEESVQNCVSQVTKEIKQIDILISNAGIFDFYPVSESGAEKLKKIVDVNVLGLTNLTKYFMPLLIPNESRLIVISSESYKVPSPFQPYSVSKQMLESLYKAIKIELSLKDIKCILIRPGAMQTKILDHTINFSIPEDSSAFKNEFEGFVKSVSKYIGKISKPVDVAKVILKAGLSNHPKQVYNINHNPLVTILSHLPFKLKDFIIKKNLK